MIRKDNRWNIWQLSCCCTSEYALYFYVTCIAQSNLESFAVELYILLTYVMHCSIWYHLYNFKILKNTHGGVLILVKLCRLKPATLIKLTLHRWWFSCFLNGTNGTKSRNAPHIRAEAPSKELTSIHVDVHTEVRDSAVCWICEQIKEVV